MTGKTKTLYIFIIIALTIFIVTQYTSLVPTEHIKFVSSVYLYGKQNVHIINDHKNVITGSETDKRTLSLTKHANSNVTKIVHPNNKGGGTSSMDKLEKGITTNIKTSPTRTSRKPTKATLRPTLRPTCPAEGSKLVGPLYIDQNVPPANFEKGLSVEFGGSVEKGGWWKPSKCTPRRKVALIIPYRKREQQLKMFLHHMHPILQRQQLFYRIIVVEQLKDSPFNRAGLFNIGFVEALKISPFDCFVFSDVDLLPEDDRNNYGCPTSPRHMSVAVDKFSYRLPYASIFGGVGSFTKEDFEKINGMSNLFFGWGGEDDDLYQRIRAKGFSLTRPSMKVGRYTMNKLQHFQSSKANPNRMNLLRDTKGRMATDGLNALKYTLKKVVEEPLVTFVQVEMNKGDYKF